MSKRSNHKKRQEIVEVSDNPSFDDIESDSNVLDYPVFSFTYFADKKHGFDCKPEEFRSLIMKLKRLGQLTWNQIDSSDRHSNGYEKIDLSQIHENTEMFSTDNALVFRYKGTKAMIGFRKSHIYHVVYLDDDYSVYNHG